MKTSRSFQNRRHLRRHSGGYTLMEIMLVLSIIAVLVAAAITGLVGTLDTAKEVRVKGDLQAITVQLRTYEMLNISMPTTEQGLQALVTLPTTEPKPTHWKQLLEATALSDPWGRAYQYKNPGVHNPTGFDLYSLGADGVESADDIGNWTTSTASGTQN